MKKKILGIDCSSTTIGLGLLEWDDETNLITFIKSSHHKPKKEGNLIERIKLSRDFITKFIDDHQPDYIAVEEILQFVQGKSTAKTIIMLTTFNRMVCLVSYDYLKRAPELFNVMSIRHGLKLAKEAPKKEEMPELVSKHLGITFPYIYKKTGKIADETYDQADSIAVALYYSFVLSSKIIRKAPAKKKAKKKL